MKLTEAALRQIINEEHQKLLEEGLVQNALDWIKEKGRAGKKQFKSFLKNLRQELSETKEGMILLSKIALGKELTPDEISFIKEQLKDVAMGVTLLGLFILPGGAFITGALVNVAKKLGFDIMPSSFKEELERLLNEEANSNMKITKSTLRRIIREEHQKMVEEGLMDFFKRPPDPPDLGIPKEAGIDPKLAKEVFSEDEWALFSMFVHRWFHPDAQTGKIAWDKYDGGNRDILEAWLNWIRRAEKVRLKPSIYKMLVNRGWAIAERPKRAHNVLSRRRKEDFYAREYPSIRRVSLTADGREKFIELIDRATKRMTDRAMAKKAAGGLSIADDGAEGALSLT